MLEVSPSSSFSDYISKQKTKMEHALTQWFEGTEKERITEAVGYSLFAPSKKLRSLLCLEVGRAFEGDDTRTMPAAMAIELVHTYSLIHDDLPALDNDQYRRGRLSNHQMYGEATALLAGDALLTGAFEILAKVGPSSLSPDIRIQWVETLSKAAGLQGMVLGQQWELEPEKKNEMETIHRKKTGALFSAAAVMGALSYTDDPEFLYDLKQFGENLGLAFQIQDDLKDKEKKTISLLGIQNAKQQVHLWLEEALGSLANISFPCENKLRELSYFVIDNHTSE